MKTMMIIFSICSIPFLALAIGFLQKPLKGTIWFLTKGLHTPVKAKIVECLIFEREGSGELDRFGEESPGFSQYFPEIKVEFEYKNKMYSSTWPLTISGYANPSVAFEHLHRIAPDQAIRYIQTYEKYINPVDIDFIKNYRISENSSKQNFIKLMINPFNPDDNESLYADFSFIYWLLFLLFFSIPAFFLPLIYWKLKDIPHSVRSAVCIVSIAISISLYYSVKAILHNSSEKSIQNGTKMYVHEHFHLMIDHTYDGSQAEQYIQAK